MFTLTFSSSAVSKLKFLPRYCSKNSLGRNYSILKERANLSHKSVFSHVHRTSFEENTWLMQKSILIKLPVLTRNCTIVK